MMNAFSAQFCWLPCENDLLAAAALSRLIGLFNDVDLFELDFSLVRFGSTFFVVERRDFHSGG